jgi:tRNA nucleotidyltransferase (CCA-adding enzyme)
VPVRFRIEDPALAGFLRQIEQLIRRAGGRTWLVGGCIRDLVLVGNHANWTSKS